MDVRREHAARFASLLVVAVILVVTAASWTALAIFAAYLTNSL